MDLLPEGPLSDDAEEQLPDFTAEMILTAGAQDQRANDREYQRRWYDSLPATSQEEVRDKIRAEISRIRSELGKRTEPVYPLPAKRREQG
ncbi:hypothetical protein [Pseudomonas sp. NA-150]|uniref:hypothetical protein n=1 Tax=Pseudomonas sp. NA-150 TaxID=3367525 RepID=UPI0037C86E8E